MNAAEFNQTKIGAKVIASLGGKRHVAKVIDKEIIDPPPYGQWRFLLLFLLLDGRKHQEWRAVGKCDHVAAHRPLGRLQLQGE